MRLRSVLPPAFLALAALALAAQAMTLKWSPKAGDKMTYKMDATFDSAAIGEVKLVGTRAETVTSVDADKIVLTGVTKMTINVAGNEIPVPDSTQVTTSKPDGTVTSVQVDGADAGGPGMRLARLTSFIYPTKPIAVGDTWTSEGKKDEKADLPGYKVEYKLVGDEKVGTFDTWKITAKGGEIEGMAPTKIDETLWISKADGTMVRSLSQLTDAVFSGQGQEISLSGKMDITRQP